DITDNWKQSVAMAESRTGTDIRVLNTELSRSVVSVYLQNTGRTQLLDYARWDVFVHYYEQNGTYHIQRLEFDENSEPGINRWSINQIYASNSLSQVEVFQPGILDPCEVARIKINLSSEPATDIPGWVVISTANGIIASVQFGG
ncbi:MAG: hypothetical protein NUV31_02370, partial [Dehalococcoidales bacterium]|nr:hypothetical protein [Dehalococcoidales bacterium]